MVRKSLCILTLIPLLLVSVLAAEARAVGPPIKIVKGAIANRAAFKDSGSKKPIVLKSEKDAAKYFDDKQLEKLEKEVDFEKQFVLVFAWQGSGQDRIGHTVLNLFPKQIVFTYKPGRTRDLRPHQLICVLRSNVKWRVK